MTNPHLQSSLAQLVLGGLQRKPVIYYGQTFDPDKKAKRQRAKAGRKANRS